ncbi:MAG: LutC/YkgG family protein [Thermodesulfobacteriota bacterium]
MIDNSREKILKRIKAGLKNAHPEAMNTLKPGFIGPKPTPSAMEDERSTLIEQFASEVNMVNGKAQIIRDRNEINENVLNIFNQYKAKTFMIWDTPFLDFLKLKDFLKVNGFINVQSEHKETLADVNIGITEVDYAIADSGTLVLMTDTGKQRLDSLIVPIHVAVLESTKIIRNIFELIDILDNELVNNNGLKRLPGCITFITGPSRTADIEFILTLGVHGPKELQVLITDLD